MIHPAYVAGCLDCDGSLGIYGCSRSYARLYICGAKDPGFVNQFRDHYEVGGVYRQTRQKRKFLPQGTPDLSEPIWIWQVCKQGDVRVVLEDIIQYMYQKRERAEVILSYLRGEISASEARQANAKNTSVVVTKVDLRSGRDLNGMLSISCVVCGAEFKAQRSHAMYCSKDCQWRGWSNRYRKTTALPKMTPSGCIDAMNRLGLSSDIGVHEAGAALRTHGYRIGNDTLGRAVKTRKTVYAT